MIDEIIACAVAYKKSENDFIEVIQNTYNDSINAGLDGSNGTMKCIVDVLAQDKIFLDKAKTTIEVMFGKHAYSKKQTQYLSDVIFTAWFDNSQKLRKNDIFDMFVVGCLDAKPRSTHSCILEDNSPCLISFDKTMKNFIGVVYPYNYQLIESIK